MKKQRYSAKRLLSLFTLVAMLMTMFDFSAFSEGEIEYSNTLDEWIVQALWEKGNSNSYDFVYNSDKNEDIYFTLTFNYFLNGASRHYNSNEIKFKVKGIGDISRSGKIKAETTTTKDDSDWDLEYDEKNDEYTFIYKREISQYQMLSGGFQMQWKINSRAAINGYTYTSSPMFIIADGEDEKSINMQPISVKYTSERDIYKIYLISQRLTGLEYEKLEEEEREYIWHNYTTNINTDIKARDIYKSDYFVSIEIPDGKSYDDVKALTKDGKEIDIIEIEDPATGKMVHGFYLFKDEYRSVNSDQCKFRLGFKKSTMDNETVKVNARLIPIFNDESQKIINDELYDSNTLTVIYYDFTYESYDYSHKKYINDGTGTLIINDIYNGKTIEFFLYAQTDRHYSAPITYSLRSFANKQTAENPPGKNETFDLIQGDDYIAIVTNGSSLRQLEENEYDFEYVRIEKDGHNYNYEVYISKEINRPFNTYTKYAEGNTSTTKTVRFEEGVKAMYVKVKGITGSYASKIYPAINFHFDWASEQEKEYSEQINPNGNIANFSFLRLIKSTDVNFAATNGENYEGLSIDGLKERDNGIYSEYLYREVVDVKLRSVATSISSLTELDDFQKSDGNYNTTVKSTGKIKSDEEGELKKFSVYTVLQKNLIVKEDLEGISVIGSATGINGETITNSMFNDNVSYELKIDNTGRQIVVCNFDFSDNPIESSLLTSVTVSFPAYVAEANYLATGIKSYGAETYTMVHDEGILKFIGSNLVRDIYDLDDDNNTNEYTAKSSAKKTIGSNIYEWSNEPKKYIKTTKTQSYVYGQEYEDVRVDSYSTNPDIDPSNSCYSYRLDFSVGANATKNIYVFDNIEPSSKTNNKNVTINSSWHGTLKSVDTSQPDSLGIISTVYCSTSENENADIKSEGWTQMVKNGSIWTVPDGIEARSIAIYYDTKNMSDKNIEGTIQDRLIYSVVNMQAPEITSENENIVNTSAQNIFNVNCEFLINGEYQTTSFESAITTVSLDQAGIYFEINKYDAQTNAALTGAEFSVYKDEACTQPVEGLTNISVNNLGKFVGKLPANGTYYIKEIKAPTGYKQSKDVTVLNADSSYTIVKIPNERMTGTLKFTKKDADDESINNLEGAEYEIYTINGTRVFTDEQNNYNTNGTKYTFVTDESGFTVTGLPWGNYYLIETKAPDGYEINEQKVQFIVSRSGTSDGEAIIVDASQADSEKTATLMLTKTDEFTGDGLKNAWYKVQKKVGDEWVDAPLPYYSTNAAGELRIDGVKFGEYRFVEINAPMGYEINSDTLIPKSVVLDTSTVGQTMKFTHSDKRKTGSINLTKYSDTGAYIENVRFDLYMVVGEKDGSSSATEGDPADQLVRQGLVTNSEGKIEEIKSLDWGEYYFVETYAPTGYKKADAIFYPETVKITAENVEVVQDVEVTDYQIRGSVKLTKYGENKQQLPSAEFVLCDKDGKQLKITRNEDGTYSYDKDATDVQLITNSNGEIIVNNLPWGVYYFEETKAPIGYAIADKVRFTVNSHNCLSLQELECEDSLVQCQITVEKEITEALPQFGDPTFIFKIKKDDNSGQEWLRTIQLSSEKKSGSFTLSVNPGKYTVEEIRVSRYTLKSIKTVDVDNDETTIVDSDKNNRKATVEFQTIEQAGKVQFAKLKFTNELSNYDKFNHVVGVNNIIPVQKKITGISVVYNGDLIPVDEDQADYIISKEKLTAKITYDDGSEEIITDMDNLTPVNGEANFTVSNGINDASSEIELQAQYTRDSKKYTTKFYVTIAPLVVTPTQKVVYRVDKGNESYFDKDGKHTTANVVYYRGDEVVTGSYVVPKAIEEKKFFAAWSDEDGNFVAADEDGVKEYLENNKDKSEITLYAEIINLSKDFDYKGDVQEFIAPVSGYYTLEVWGASGGDGFYEKYIENPTEENKKYISDTSYSAHAGAGGYSHGEIYLNKGEKLYVIVGGRGTYAIAPHSGGYNGGGGSFGINQYGAGYGAGYGGGMTHISKTSNVVGTDTYNEGWVKADNWNPDGTIIVAGGGGGTDDWDKYIIGGINDGAGGYGGGENGGNAKNRGKLIATGTAGTGGTQTSGYKQGNGESKSFAHDSGGGGGSGYISDELKNAATIAGNQTFLAPDGTEETGHWGNGYARITLLRASN